MRCPHAWYHCHGHHVQLSRVGFFRPRNRSSTTDSHAWTSKYGCVTLDGGQERWRRYRDRSRCRKANSLIHVDLISRARSPRIQIANSSLVGCSGCVDIARHGGRTGLLGIRVDSRAGALDSSRGIRESIRWCTGLPRLPSRGICGSRGFWARTDPAARWFDRSGSLA